MNKSNDCWLSLNSLITSIAVTSRSNSVMFRQSIIIILINYDFLMGRCSYTTSDNMIGNTLIFRQKSFPGFITDLMVVCIRPFSECAIIYGVLLTNFSYKFSLYPVIRKNITACRLTYQQCKMAYINFSICVLCYTHLTHDLGCKITCAQKTGLTIRILSQHLYQIKSIRV